MADGDNAANRSPGTTGGSAPTGREPTFDYPRDANGFTILKGELREATRRLPGRVAKVAGFLIDDCANAEHFYATGAVLVWPATSTIAVEAGTCERTGQRAIDDLVKALALVPTGFSRKRIGRRWVRFESDGRCGSGVTIEYAWSPAWLRNRLAEIRTQHRQQPSLVLPIDGGEKGDRPAAERVTVLSPFSAERVTTASGKGDNSVPGRVTVLTPYSLEGEHNEGEPSERERETRARTREPDASFRDGRERETDAPSPAPGATDALEITPPNGRFPLPPGMMLPSEWRHDLEGIEGIGVDRAWRKFSAHHRSKSTCLVENEWRAAFEYWCMVDADGGKPHRPGVVEICAQVAESAGPRRPQSPPPPPPDVEASPYPFPSAEDYHWHRHRQGFDHSAEDWRRIRAYQAAISDLERDGRKLTPETGEEMLREASRHYGAAPA